MSESLMIKYFVPVALDYDLGAGRVGDREVITTSVITHLGRAAKHILGHHLVRLAAVVDQNGDIAVSCDVLGVLEGIEDDTHTHKLLCTAMDNSISMVTTLGDPQSNTVSKKGLALTANSKLKYR